MVADIACAVAAPTNARNKLGDWLSFPQKSRGLATNLRSVFCLAGENAQDLAISATDTVSTAFMGMTVGCAKCHDHNADLISQREYYAR